MPAITPAIPAHTPGTTAQGNGKLKLTVTPTTAKVRIGGTYVNVNGGTGVVTEDLSYGSHTVEVSAAGYKTQTFAVSISEGTVTKTVTLEEAIWLTMGAPTHQAFTDAAWNNRSRAMRRPPARQAR